MNTTDKIKKRLKVIREELEELEYRLKQPLWKRAIMAWITVFGWLFGKDIKFKNYDR